MTPHATRALLGAALLGAALLAAACSDTSCRERLVPGGGVEVNPQCGVIAADDPDAGNPANNSANNSSANNSANNNPDDPDAGNNSPANNSPANNSPANNSPANNSPANNAPQPATLTGEWISAGEDIAPLLRQGGFEIDALEVTFTETDYAGVILLGTGDEVPYGGTYSVNRNTTPWTIVLRQTAPQALTSQGLVEVTGSGDAAVMRLEIVQVDPPTLGAQPPTPEGGFGSTQGVEDPADNIQIYRRP